MIAVSVLMGITGWLSAGPGSVDEEVVLGAGRSGTGEGT